MGNYHVPFWRAVEEVTSSLTLIISAIGAVIVNQPRGSGLSCKLDLRIGRKTEYVQLSLFDISRASESSHLSR
jgi:hypothetical protein